MPVQLRLFSTLRGAASRLVVALSVAAAAALAHAAPTFTNLGVLPSATATSFAHAINADGTVVAGYGDVGSFGATRAFRWTQAGGMIDLGVFNGGSIFQAFGISGNGGLIAGFANQQFVGPRAVQWTAGSGVQYVGSAGALPGHGFGLATGVSGDGTTIVGSSDNGAGTGRAFRWTSGQGMADLGTLPGFNEAYAHAVNSDGTVVVGTHAPASILNNDRRAFRWTLAQGLQDLGTFPQGTPTDGTCVSADGSIVAGPASGPGLTNTFFRWTAATGMVAVAGFPGGINPSPKGMSADGSVIVGMAGNGAFLWTPCLGSVNLQTYLPTLGINLTGWTLSAATGISADGSAICGWGFFNGQTRAWVVQGLSAAGGAAPAITAHPGNAFDCYNGPGNSFTVAAGGLGSLTTQWQLKLGAGGTWANIADGTVFYNGFALATFSGAQTNTLTFANANTEEVQPFVRAVVSNACGSATSNEATFLAFNAGCCTGPAATINTHPTGDTRFPGQSLTMTAGAAGDGPLQTVWQASGGPFTEWTTLADGPLVVGGITRATISGSGGTVLTVGNIAFDFGEVYFRFVASNSCSIAYSFPATLVVADPCAEPGAVPQIFTTLGDDVRCFNEEIAYFLDASGLAPLTYQWQFNGGPFADWTTLVDGPLVIDGIQRAVVSASQTNAPIVSQLRFDPAVISVRCIVSNACGSATSNAGTLTLQNCFCGPEALPIVTVQPTDANACTSQSPEFSAENSGQEPFTYQWQINGGPFTGWTNLANGDLIVGGILRGTVTGAQGLTVTLADLQFDFGTLQVRWVVANDCAIAISDTADLTIEDCCPPGIAPLITTHPTDDTRCFGEEVGYFPAVTGAEPLTYQWQLNGGPFADWTNLADGPLLVDGIERATISGGQGGVLVMSNLRFDPALISVRWVVTNDCGTAVSNAGTLTIQDCPACDPEDLPVIITQPESTLVCFNDNTTFLADPIGSEPFTYQWQINGGPFAGWTNLTDGDLFIEGVFRASVFNPASHFVSLNNLQFALGTLSVRCVISNPCRIVVSDVATLTIDNHCCPLDYNLDTVMNPDDLGDFITDYFTDPAIPGPGGYAVLCPENEVPYDAGYKAAYVPGLSGQCNPPFPDNLGDFITDYFATTCE
ncbi:MAG: hypothetical protein ACKVS8_03475 [Phycisphaerales bacterium]